MDKPIIFYSINLIIELSRERSVEALDDLFCALSNVLDEKEMEYIINESVQFLRKNEPALAEWWTTELMEEFEGFIKEEEGRIILDDSLEDPVNFISEEEDQDLNDQLRSQLIEMGEQIAYLPCYQENEDEETMYANISDVVHVLMDEGFSDYKFGKSSIYVGPESMEFLKKYYEIHKYKIQFINNINVK